MINLLRSFKAAKMVRTVVCFKSIKKVALIALLAVLLSNTIDAQVIAGSFPNSVALNCDGTVSAWGNNDYGQLGNGTTTRSYTPVQVSGLTGVIGVAEGVYTSYALKSDGTVWAWGNNGSGQLGNGTTTNSSTPVQVVGPGNVGFLTGIIAISANNGGNFCLALRSDGTVWAWGYNNDGQLGNGTTTNSATPVQVSGITTATAIAAGTYHSIALLSTGAIEAWGYNYYGQLGNGTTTDSYTPVQVSGITTATAIAAGEDHSIALLSTGAIEAWGFNGAGQLGNGTTTNSSTPVSVSGITTATAIAAGSYHSIALLSTGAVEAWGDNYYGQLGNGTTTNSSTPVSVSGLHVCPVPAPTITSFTPAAACPGSTVTITGTNFTTSTAVSFGGTAAASFTVVNNTTITAIVAAGSTGKITVTAPGGTATSAGTFYQGAGLTAYAYIANTGSASVSVINTATNTVTATVNVGGSPVGVSISPDNSKAYVANNFDNTVSVINTATNTVTATIPVGSGPYGVAVSPDGSKAYVANSSDNTVSVINTATNTVTAIVTVGPSPQAVSVTPDGTQVYVTNSENNTVSVISTATNTINTITVGSFPQCVSVSPDGSKAYVTNFDGTVSVINTATNTVTATINVGNDPYGVAVSPDGSKAYVVNEEDNTVSVINTATNTVTATINVGGVAAQGICVSPDGSQAYVPNYNGTVNVINTSTNTVTANVVVGSYPGSIGNFIATVVTPCPPAITNFSPASACAGSGALVTITGTNFSAATAVTFNDTAASFTVVNSNTITAILPKGATTGVIAVTTAGGTGSSSTNFTVNAKPVATLIQVNPDCNGHSGSLSSTVTGGMAPYSYSLNFGAYGSNPLYSPLTGKDYVYIVKDANACTDTLLTALTQLTQEPILVGNASPGTVNVCYGAITTITTNVVGGNAPFTYTLNGGSAEQVTGRYFSVGAGSYSITVTDNSGCTYTTNTVTVTQPSIPLSLSPSITNATCTGTTGSITITAAGGYSSSYTYSDNGGASYQPGSSFTSLAPGTYYLAVKDANGCKLLGTAQLAATFATSPIIGNLAVCYGADATISTIPQGGASPYLYSLDGGGTVAQASRYFSVPAGSHTITVTDNNGCTATATATVTQPAAPVSFSSVTGGQGCSNTAGISITAAGGYGNYSYSDNGGSSYQSSSLFSGLSYGSYTLAVKDQNGCAAPNSVVTFAPFTTSPIQGDTTVCPGGSVTIYSVPSGGIPPYSYSLDNAVFVASNQRYFNVTAGTHTITVKDNASCTVTPPAITIVTDSCIKSTLSTAPVIASAAKQSNEGFTAHIEPNPTPSTFHLQLQSSSREDVQLVVTNILGVKVYEAKGSIDNAYEFGAAFKNGIYILQILQGNTVHTVKLVKGN